MPEDNHTRIIISVENGDAVQKCKELEVGLENVTEARKADVDAAHSATQAATQNAQAMEREAAAVNKTAHAIKKVNWNALAKERREFAKFIREEEKKEAERNITPEREAATKELRERKRVMREAQREQERMSKISNAFLDEEIKDQRVLVAEKRKQLAIEKEIILQRKLNDIRDRLNTPEVRNNPQAFRELLDKRNKYEYQSMYNSQEILNSERNLRNVRKASMRDYRGDFMRSAAEGFKRQSLNVSSSVKAMTKTVGKSKSVFQTAARGIGRSLSHIARLGGRSLGMAMPTEGMTVPGGGFIAGAAAIGGVSMLVGRIIEMRREGRETQRADKDRLIADFADITSTVREENAERQKSINSLKQIATSEKLSNAQRVQQEILIKKLNDRMGGLTIEVDRATGRIKNLAQVTEEDFQQGKRREISAMEREYNEVQNQIQRNNDFLASGSDWFNQLINGDEIASVKQQNEALYKRAMELQKSLAETRREISPEEERNRIKISNAELEDWVKQLRESQQQRLSQLEDKSNAWKTRQEELLKTEEQIKILREKTSAEQLKHIEELKNCEFISVQEAYNRELTEYKNDLLELAELEKKITPYQVFNRNVEKQIQDMRNEVRLQKLINEGKEDEAEIERIRLGILQKINSEGWSPEQAKKWGRLQAMQYDISTKLQRNSIAGAGVQFRDTSVASVNANSMEALRLQSRMLVRNTPQTQLLNYTQKQTKMLEYIENKMRQWLPGKDSTQIKTATV